MTNESNQAPAELIFTGELWYWRGPAPWYFVSVPEQICLDLHEEAEFVSYGWGMIPVQVQIGGTRWETSLWPKDGGYIVPVKTAVRHHEHLEDGDTVTVRLLVATRTGAARTSVPSEDG